MTAEWYNDIDKVVELGEFLVQSEEITSTDELLEYFKHPQRYTEVWNIYEKEILGTERIILRPLRKVPSCNLRHVSTDAMSTGSVAQCG